MDEPVNRVTVELADGTLVFFEVEDIDISTAPPVVEDRSGKWRTLAVAGPTMLVLSAVITSERWLRRTD